LCTEEGESIALEINNGIRVRETCAFLAHVEGLRDRCCRGTGDKGEAREKIRLVSGVA
jgi:hypothetical protein